MKLRGWVYVMTNQAMPGLLKIGCTTRDPILRASDLESAGVPYSFQIEYDVVVPNPRSVEAAVHRELANHRENKEWFRVDMEVAIQSIIDNSGEAFFETYHSDEWEDVDVIEDDDNSDVKPFLRSAA